MSLVSGPGSPLPITKLSTGLAPCSHPQPPRTDARTPNSGVLGSPGTVSPSCLPARFQMHRIHEGQGSWTQPWESSRGRVCLAGLDPGRVGSRSLWLLRSRFTFTSSHPPCCPCYPSANHENQGWGGEHPGDPSRRSTQAEWERWVNSAGSQERECYLEQTSSPHPVNLLFIQSQGNAGSGLCHRLGHRPEPHLPLWPPEVTKGPYLTAVHAALQVAGAEHGGGDDASVHVSVVADLVGD